ncbi:MAG: putative toxin-antitoxin system toxin component, PIN family [Actinomycetia bacterium]|nr:putative toxin-antitoxin system toxin component, PIN family [Actinomycetes bacterium]
MRVVIDANVFVSAAIGLGPSHRVVQAVVFSQYHDAIVSPTLIGEIEDVLSRPRLRKRISADQAAEFIEDLRIMATRVPDPIDIGQHTRDPKDDYLVALAQHHAADYIVTGDKDLHAWPEQRPPAITPAEFKTILTNTSQ